MKKLFLILSTVLLSAATLFVGCNSESKNATLASMKGEVSKHSLSDVLNKHVSIDNTADI